MNVLVTGGAGYLGSVLVPLLLAQGHRVTVLDNFLYAQTPLLDQCHDPNLDIVRDDARHRSVLERVLESQDALVPLACLTGAPACARDMTTARTVVYEAIDLIARLKKPEQVLVFPMTNSGYGVSRPGEACSEDAELHPVSLYGRLKVSAERAVLAHPNTVSLRFATLFGASPRMRCDLLVNDFVYRAVVDGWLVLYEAYFTRTVLHVRDAAHAILWTLQRLVTGGGLSHRVYNAGLPDGNLSKVDLCHAIRRHLSHFRWFVSPSGRDPDRRDYGIECARIFAEGWRPERSLDDGIRELIKTYQIVRGTGHGNA